MVSLIHAKVYMMHAIDEALPRWQREVQTFLQSGMVRSEYCKQHNVNPQQLLNWLGRHYEASSNLIPVKISDQPSIHRNSALSCRIELPNGCKLDIHDLSILGVAFNDLVQALDTPRYQEKTDHDFDF